jgi:predicted nucleic acid-binding protein
MSIPAYYCPEPISPLAERALRNLSSPAIGELTLVEFASAVSREIREKSLAREEGARILTQFESHLEGGYYLVLPVRTVNYRMARSWLAQLQGTLRTFDALHLADAESAGTLTLTADRRMAAETQAIGLPVKLLTISRAH